MSISGLRYATAWTAVADRMLLADVRRLQFARVYFTDIILLSVRLVVVPASSTIATDAELTLVAMETLSSAIYRAGHVNASGTTFSTQLTGANFTAQPPDDVYGTKCNLYR